MDGAETSVGNALGLALGDLSLHIGPHTYELHGLRKLPESAELYPSTHPPTVLPFIRSPTPPFILPYVHLSIILLAPTHPPIHLFIHSLTSFHLFIISVEERQALLVFFSTQVHYFIFTHPSLGCFHRWLL